MRHWIVALLVVFACDTATAQDLLPADREKTDKFEVSLEGDITPMLGTSLPLAAGSNPVEFSEYAAMATFKWKDAIGKVPLKVKLGVFSWPDNFDSSNAESSAFGEIVLGDDPYSVQQFRFGAQDADRIEDSVAPTAAFRYARVHSGLFGAYARDEKTLTWGVTFKDVRSIVCARKAVPLVKSQTCGDQPGISFKLTGQVAKLWSSDDGENRLSPRIKLTVTGPVVGNAAFLFVRADYEIRYYDARLATNERRTDYRLLLTGGFDIAPLLAQKRGWIDTAEVGVAYFRGRSNKMSANFDRGYFAPALILIKAFN